MGKGTVNRNYQREMEQIIRENREQGRVPSLLLHSCCGPCSSSVLERLTAVSYTHLDVYKRQNYGSDALFKADATAFPLHGRTVYHTEQISQDVH